MVALVYRSQAAGVIAAARFAGPAAPVLAVRPRTDAGSAPAVPEPEAGGPVAPPPPNPRAVRAGAAAAARVGRALARARAGAINGSVPGESVPGEGEKMQVGAVS
ncbi:hypothetical protein ACFC0M_08180 [Streptomyces sp. NPDC056149]|uniref:hypothetical protein n=1 Tax=Streptomyces sp. NPDC056149 TaxID=3345728 RepID=UPI0035E2A323